MKKLLLSLLLPLFSFISLAQGGSCDLRISLLTCAPGEELYSTFGHTALRVSDAATGTDYVFNYGTFQFGPDFYSQFIRGKLLYFLSVENFGDFLEDYRQQRRSIQEQVLQLDCKEKQQLLEALQRNAQEENKYYRYDFLFDNCTTRAKDMVKNNAGGTVVFQNILPTEWPSFRDLIHSYLDAGHQPWSKFGIDLLLGAKLDRKVSNEEAMFLPDYLLKGFDEAKVNGRPLVAPPQTILDVKRFPENLSIFTPLFVFTFFSLLIAVLSFLPFAAVRMAVSIFDFLLFFVSGLAGCLLLFMWFGTDHAVCANNWNLFWALPTHLAGAFYVHSGKRWVRNYFTFTGIISLFLLLTWIWLPQQLNNALIPILLLFAFRSWRLSKNKTHASTGTAQ